MRRSTSRWIVGVAVGGIAHIGIFWVLVFFGEPSGDTQSPRNEKGARLAYIGSDTGDLSPIMKQQLELFDPKPLMQPTDWNTANFDRPDAYVEADLEIFVDYEPIYGSEDGAFASAFGNQWTAPRSPKAALLDFPFEATSQFGRVALSLPQLKGEGVELEIVEMDDGTVVFENVYYNSAAQEILEIPGTWGIASFIIQVVDSFQVGLPLIDESVGNLTADGRVSEIVVADLLPKGLLNNGSFRVRISR